jgi:sterol desaturase/sphingolipid hydroxylase (fatty acid hydroxylase superfamily)
VSIDSNDIYAIGVPFIVLMILAEVSFSGWRNRNFYQRDDFFGTLGLLAGNITIAGLTKGAVLALSFYLYQFRLFELSTSLPLWSQWLLTFLAIDLVFYCYHRLSHRVRVLWAVHMNHHCSQQMNFSVSFRQAWFGPISKIPFFAVLPLIGFDPSITVVVGVISTLWGVLGHTRWIGNLGPVVEFIFNTPSAHRVHHGSNPEYIDKNFGNLLMIWDRMFGTYAKEEAAVVFGLVSNIETNNPFVLTFYVWKNIFRDIQNSASFKNIWLSMFGPPEWQLALPVTESRNEKNA